MSGYFALSSVATVAVIEASTQDDIGCRKTENFELANSCTSATCGEILWKSEQLRLKLGSMVHWKSLRGMDDRFVGRRIAQQPSADDFAGMLQTLLDGKPSPPRQPVLLTENAWTVSELTTGPPHWHK